MKYLAAPHINTQYLHRQQRAFNTYLLLLCLWLLPTGGNASPIEDAKLIDVELMPGTKASWIARQMQLNGVPASIRLVRNSQTKDEVLEFYQETWSEISPVMKHQRGQWTILSTKIKGNFVSLQLNTGANNGTSEGLLVITADPQKFSATVNNSLPLPPSFKVLSHQNHQDSGASAETITLSSPQNVGVTRSTLTTSMTNAGYRVVQDRSATSVSSGHTLKFLKNRDVVNVFIGFDTRWNDETLILLTWKKS